MSKKMMVGLVLLVSLVNGLVLAETNEFRVWTEQKGSATHPIRTSDWYNIGPQYNLPVLKGTTCGTAAIGAPALAVTNRYVVDTAMQATAYTIANSGLPGDGMARNITATVTTDSDPTPAPDSLGTLNITGQNWAGDTITESITLVAGSTATGTKCFKKVTAIISPAWIAGGTADHIVVGFGNLVGLPQEVMATGSATRYLSGATMKATAYTVLNSGLPGDGCSRNIVITHTANGTADTLAGGLWVYGTDWTGKLLLENIAITSGGVSTGSKCFKTVTQLLTPGWLAAAGADTLSVGTGNLMIGPSGRAGSPAVDFCTVGTAIIEATVTGGPLESSTIDASAATYNGSKLLRVWVHQ